MEYSKGKNAWTALSIMGEYVDSKDILEGFKEKHGKNVVTVFGSARLDEESEDYKLCEEFTKKLSELGNSVITGGGPGIMEAANKGVYQNLGNLPSPKVKSVGIGVDLPFEGGNNDYISHGYNMSLKYFFVRKIMLIDYSKEFFAFKGGMGTLDELFETVTLMQTGKITKRPIYLVGSEFWGGLVDWIKEQMLSKNKTISEKDLDLFKIIDTFDEYLENNIEPYD